MTIRTIAKLSRPRIYDAVPRARLFARLDDGLQRPITFISGPPGVGKTTLIATYLRERSLAAVWYHVDENDVDPATIFFYLGQLASSRSRRKTELPLFTPEYLPDLKNFSRRFCRTLFDQLPERVILVFDNTHSVGPDSAFHSIVVSAAQEAPEGVAIIWIGRVGPDPAYTRLFAYDSAVEIGHDELLLTPDETNALAKTKFGLKDEEAVRLFQQTQGWAAGIVLLAQNWKRGGGAQGSGYGITPESVGHYFESEILESLSSGERLTLMRTALLPTVTPGTAVALSNDPKAEEVMEKLLRRGLFVLKQVGSYPRYRFHDLFRDFLIDSLHITLAPEAWRDALLRAAEVALQAGDFDSALPLLCKAQDIERAAEMVRSNARMLLETGRFKTLLAWIEQLGAETLERDPWIRFWHGRALMITDIAEARAAFENAYDQFKTNGDCVGELMAATQMIYSYYYEYIDYSPMAKWVGVIDSLLTSGTVAPDLESDADIRAALILSGTWLGDVDERLFVRRAEQLLRETVLGLNQRVCLGYALLDYYTLGSRMADAQRVTDYVMPLLSDPACTPLTRAYAYLQIGYSRLRAGEGQQARRVWQISDDTARANGLTETVFVSRLFHSYLFSSEGDPAGAEACMRGLDGQFSNDQPLSGALYHIAGVLMEMAREDGVAAARHAKLSLQHATRLGGGFVNVAWRAHGSAALALAGEHEEAEKWIEEGLSLARGTWLECYRTNLLMSRAYSLLLRGKRESARPVIAELLSLAWDRAWWTYLRMLPRVKDVILREAIVENIELPTAQALVRNLRASPGVDPPPEWPWPIRVFTMGEFSVVLNGKPLAFARKAQKRPLALLKALIALGGRGVGTEYLAESLWAESEADDAESALTMTLHRLRRLLGDEGAIVVREGKCSLDPSIVWVDAWALERSLDADLKTDIYAQFEKIRALYRGHFLVRDEEQGWLIPMQQRLRTKWRRVCVQVGRALEQSGRIDEARCVYERGIEIEPLAEELYQKLIECHRRCGRVADAVETYRRCQQLLTVTLGTKPSPILQALFQELKGE